MDSQIQYCGHRCGSYLGTTHLLLFQIDRYNAAAAATAAAAAWYDAKPIACSKLARPTEPITFDLMAVGRSVSSRLVSLALEENKLDITISFALNGLLSILFLLLTST